MSCPAAVPRGNCSTDSRLRQSAPSQHPELGKCRRQPPISRPLVMRLKTFQICGPTTRSKLQVTHGTKTTRTITAAARPTATPTLLRPSSCSERSIPCHLLSGSGSTARDQEQSGAGVPTPPSQIGAPGSTPGLLASSGGQPGAFPARPLAVKRAYSTLIRTRSDV